MYIRLPLQMKVLTFIILLELKSIAEILILLDRGMANKFLYKNNFVRVPAKRPQCQTVSFVYPFLTNYLEMVVACETRETRAGERWNV